MQKKTMSLKVAILISMVSMGIIIGSVAAIAHNTTTIINKAAQQYATDRAKVQALCGVAKTNGLDHSKKQCAIVQEETNTKYLCDDTDTTCWVEHK